MTFPAELDFVVINLNREGPETFSTICGLEYFCEPPPSKVEDVPERLQPAFVKGLNSESGINPYPEFYRNGRFNPRYDAWEWGALA